MDLEMIANDIYCNGDFKSSNGLYNGIRMQTVAYGNADEEEGGKKKYKGRWAIRFSKYTEAEYMKRELRKKFIKQTLARIQGKEFKDYPIKPYKVFDAQFLDYDKDSMGRDFDAFLHAKALREWDVATDSFNNGGNLEQPNWK